jgi:hypothetical protein
VRQNAAAANFPVGRLARFDVLPDIVAARRLDGAGAGGFIPETNHKAAAANR